MVKRPGSLSLSSSVAVAFDPDLLRFGSLLIYCRASLILSLLVYSGIAALVYSDLYVHLIRGTTGVLAQTKILPGTLFPLLMAGCLYLAYRLKPLLERAALLLLAVNFSVLFFRRRLETDSESYLILCVLSVVLDLGLLAAVIAFYRKYPNYLKVLRKEEHF